MRVTDETVWSVSSPFKASYFFSTRSKVAAVWWVKAQTSEDNGFLFHLNLDFIVCFVWHLALCNCRFISILILVQPHLKQVSKDCLLQQQRVIHSILFTNNQVKTSVGHILLADIYPLLCPYLCLSVILFRPAFIFSTQNCIATFSLIRNCVTQTSFPKATTAINKPTASY